MLVIHLLAHQREPACEGRWQLESIASEHIVILGELSLLVGFRLPATFLPVLSQQAVHLRQEVHIPIPCCGLRIIHDNVLASDLDHIPLNMDGALLEVDVGSCYTI